MPREHGKDGTYVETVKLEDVLDVFDTVDGPVILSADVADALECSRETARRKLQQLHDRGDLEKRKVSRRVVYWRAEREGFDAGGLQGDPETTLDDTDAEDAARTAGAGDATEHTREERNAESGRTRDESEDPVDDARDRLDALDLAGSGTDYERRRDAILMMYEHLQERPADRVSKSDFADLLDGTDVGYGGGFASLWANWVKSSGDRPNALDTLPGVELQGNDYVFRPEGER